MLILTLKDNRFTPTENIADIEQYKEKNCEIRISETFFTNCKSKYVVKVFAHVLSHRISGLEILINRQ
jgi:hypothetical protein